MKDIFDINQAGEHPSFPDLDPTMHDVGRSRGDDSRFKFPDKYKPAPKKKSATNQLTDDIIKCIRNDFKGAARRVNNIGRVLEGEVVEQGMSYTLKAPDKYIPSQMKKGFEDIDAVIPIQVVVFGQKVGASPFPILGLKLAIEVKTGKDRQGEYQKKRQQEVEQCGGIYIIAKDIEQFRAELQEKLSKYL